MKDIFSLTNLIKQPTVSNCRLALFLTNRPRSFMKSQNSETGLSYYHKLICSIVRASFKKLPLKITKYRDQKHFDQKKFLHDLNDKLLQGDRYRNCDDRYKKFQKFLLIC